MDSLPTQLAEAIQDSSIVRHPDPIHDNAPTSAAERRQPVSLHNIKRHYDDVISDDEEDIPYSVLRPLQRTNNLPPLPDLRFEQSYLRSIANADTWWKILLITARDQVLLPLTQGVVYNLFVCGWQQWNRNARLHGNTVGARVRRWWWEVNNWNIPTTITRTAKC